MPRPHLTKNSLNGFLSLFALLCVLCLNAMPARAACPTFTFATTVSLNGGYYMYQLASGDFNNDGKLDLVTSNGFDIVVYLGNGMGGFAAPIASAPPANMGVASAVAAGDFNNDGKLDLAVNSASQPKLGVMLGDGTGAFPNTSVFNTTGTRFPDLLAADCNRDGKLDVVAADAPVVVVYLGDGAGHFTVLSGYVAGDNPYHLAQGDFNGDGLVDLAVGNYNSQNISILLGSLSGGFRPPTETLALGMIPTRIVTADINHDGYLDVAASAANINGQGDMGFIKIFFGFGGSFGSGVTIPMPSGPRSLALADLNSDGKLDLVVPFYASQTVSIYRGFGNSTFSSAGNFPTPGYRLTSVLVGNFNNDADPDIFVQGEGFGFNDYKVTELLHTCSVPTAVFDFDGDHRTDLGVVRSNGSNWIWYILRSNETAFGYQPWGLPTDKLAPADYDGDGTTDVAIYRQSQARFWIFRSSNNTFYSDDFGSTNIPTDSQVLPLPADYDGDGKDDIAIWKINGLTYKKSSTNFVDGVFFQTANSAHKPLAGKFDGPGSASIALYDTGNSPGLWTIYNVTAQTTRTQQWGVSTDIPAPCDFDGDGRWDVAVFRPSTGFWYILYSSNGDITAAPFGTTGDRPVPGDYDGDGKCDLAVFRPSNGNWYIYNSGSSTFRADHFGLNGDIPTPAAYLP